jgi:flagellar biosynthesis/type III secretory pathway protein FliH
MRLFSINKLAAITGLGMALVFGTTMANAQGNNNSWKKDQKQIAKTQKEQNKWEAQRQAELNRRRPVYTTPVVNYDRYRVYRNGSYYNTDSRGASLLRQAVQAGYQQGYAAGRNDRNSRRGLNWNNSNVYRSGTYGWQNYVDRSQHHYYFQQGFQRGYQDGYNSRYQYGTYNNGSANILGSILNTILNITNN